MLYHYNDISYDILIVDISRIILYNMNGEHGEGLYVIIHLNTDSKSH